MTWDAWAAIGQLIGAVGVIASLIFVGIQLHHSTLAVRGAASQAYSALYYEINSSIISSGELARIWRESLADFDSRDADDKVRFIALASSIFRFYESSRAQWLRGQLDHEHWNMVERQATTFASQPGIRSWWKLRRQWHSAPFREWYETLPVVDSGTIYGEESKASGTHS